MHKALWGIMTNVVWVRSRAVLWLCCLPCCARDSGVRCLNWWKVALLPLHVIVKCGCICVMFLECRVLQDSAIFMLLVPKENSEKELKVHRGSATLQGMTEPFNKVPRPLRRFHHAWTMFKLSCNSLHHAPLHISRLVGDKVVSHSC